MERKFSLPASGYEVVLGKFAKQAESSAWLQCGGTVVLATVCSAPSVEFPGFLPLTVDYREQFSAAGKIPGGYFKREGKFSDHEVLISRLIDRSIRPLFPENYFDKVQVMVTVYSADQENAPEMLALIATSIALSTSKIPFMGPVGAAEIGRIDGEWIVSPKFEQIQKSDVRIIVAGTDEGICMIEGSGIELQNDQMIDAFFLAHAEVKKQVAWQKEMQEALSVVKTPITDLFDWKVWAARVNTVLSDERVIKLFIPDKIERSMLRSEYKAIFLAEHAVEIAQLGINPVFLEYIFDKNLRNRITELCFTHNKRIDGRDFDKVRQISTEVGLLPFAHGSALFTRGRTQALVTVTLGGGQDKGRSDRLMGPSVESSFMLHYNFPSFSVGEVRPQRGPGRREIGHGYLAHSSLERMLPDQEKFPYTLRIVADMLESDGSTSMATVCGSTMALMDAGVPLKKMVSGIAMGLLRSESGKFQVLTDIAGIEDEFGLMDFKVAGTDDGITAIQMDIKYKGGLERSVFEMALAAADKARHHIMGEMKKVMSAPRAELSPNVPQIVSFRVPVDKIGAIIGSGGKVIREIIEKTGVAIDIEDDGLVKIYGHPSEKMDQAISWAKILGGQIETGSTHHGTVKRIAEFGLFVEIAPGQDGLVHISTIPRTEQDKFMRNTQVGDKVNVEVMDYDPSTGRIRLKII